MRILLAPLLVAVSLPAFAEVDSKIHKLCIEAKDYAGCVRAMKGESSTETTVNQIQRQGANLTEGNTCPAQHVYSGGGYCQRIICVKRGLFGKGHDAQLAEKAISCSGGAEIEWDNAHQPIRASFNKNCPHHEPEIGYQSTCLQAHHKGYVPYISTGFKFDNNGFVIKLFAEPAKSSGLAIGDKVLSLDGRTLDEHRAFLRNKNTNPLKAGQEVEIKISRNGRIKIFNLISKWQKVLKSDW